MQGGWWFKRLPRPHPHHFLPLLSGGDPVTYLSHLDTPSLNFQGASLSFVQPWEIPTSEIILKITAGVIWVPLTCVVLSSVGNLKGQKVRNEKMQSRGHKQAFETQPALIFLESHVKIWFIKRYVRERVQGKWISKGKKNTKCLENCSQVSMTKQKRVLQGKGVFTENKKGMQTLLKRPGRATNYVRKSRKC